MKLVRVRETCAGCPSAWDAWTDEDDYVYMRFRHGIGRIRVNDVVEWSFEYGDPLLGVISLDKFCKLAGLEIADNADIKLWPLDDKGW